SRVFHLNAKARNFVREIVEHPHSRNGHSDTESSSNESFGDSGANGADTSVLGICQGDECTDNADDGSEESHERSRRTNGSKARKAAFEFGSFNGDGAVKSALRSFHFVGRDIRTAL